MLGKVDADAVGRGGDGEAERAAAVVVGSAVASVDGDVDGVFAGCQAKGRAGHPHHHLARQLPGDEALEVGVGAPALEAAGGVDGDAEDEVGQRPRGPSMDLEDGTIAGFQVIALAAVRAEQADLGHLGLPRAPAQHLALFLLTRPGGGEMLGALLLGHRLAVGVDHPARVSVRRWWPRSSQRTRSQSAATRSREWLTSSSVRPAARNSSILRMQRWAKASSPTASTSSTSNTSGSVWMATANPSRTYMPDE